MKLGVFGGTFDPIHLGHLHVARRSLQLFGLSEIHFVVAGAPPHKLAPDLIPFGHRFAMVALATSNSRKFLPSLIELEPPPSPYSIHTLGKLARRQHQRPQDLYFIAGGDSLLDISNWRASEELLTTYTFVFVVRRGVGRLDPLAILPKVAAGRIRDLRGSGFRQMRKRILAEEKTEENRIFIVELGAPNVSSSQIRTLVAQGKRTRHLLPLPVHEYILKEELYGGR